MGQSPPSSSYNEDGVGLPFFQGKTEFGSIYPDVKKWCSQPQKISQKGDVLLSIRAPVGPTNVAPYACCIGRGLAAIRGKNEIGTGYILFLMRWSQEEIRKKATGTTFEAISKKDISDFNVPLAPLPEQRRIVTKIEELFTQLDSAKSVLLRAQVNLKRYRGSVLQAAFSGELTKAWRHKNHPESAEKLINRIVKERNFRWEAKLRKKKVKITNEEYTGIKIIKESDFPLLPGGWVMTEVGIIGEVIGGGTPPTKDSTNFDGEIPWITPADLSNYSSKFISKGRRNLSPEGLKSSSATLMPKGSILFSSRAPIGYVAIAENQLCTNQGFKSIVPETGIVSEYIYYFLKNSKNLAEQKASGTTFLEISKSSFSKLQIPLPPQEEQIQIVQEIENRYYVLNEIEKILVGLLLRIDTLRQSILQRAFTGLLQLSRPQ